MDLVKDPARTISNKIHDDIHSPLIPRTHADRFVSIPVHPITQSTQYTMTASTQPPIDDPHADEPCPSAAGWSSRKRIIVSVLLVGHLLAVAVPPLAFQTIGPLGLSPAVETLLVPVEHYSQMLYMDRGYAFFAPDPGPSHLIQVGLTDGKGTLTERTYPDRQQQWPRLLYHRHFMLAEFLNDIHQPPGPSTELIKEDPEAATSWSNARARYERVRRSMSEHLEYAHPGSSVAIRRIEHLIPGVLEFQEQPISLTDPRLYQVLLDQPMALQSVGDLVAPNRPPEAVAVPENKQLDDVPPTDEPPTDEPPASKSPDEASDEESES